MKRTLLIILTLLMILPASAVAREGLAVSRKPIRTAVSFFRNTTGDPSLDWVSWGAQDAITTDLKYLRYKAGGKYELRSFNGEELPDEEIKNIRIMFGRFLEDKNLVL